MVIFPTFLFGNIGQEICFCNILERKTVFLGYKNKKFNQSKNWDFSKGVNPWFWSENGHFSNVFFFCHIRQENVFYDILERKNAFLGYKNKKVKKSKNWDFSKGVNPWFCSKNCNFSSFFFLGNIGRKNMFNDILEPKNDIVRHKNKRFKQSKNGDFFKGVNPWF